jgi:GTP-binding protein
VLGMVEVEETSFVVADIPGILEGASTGTGLGLRFLRHVERTRVLLHVVDASGTSGRDPVADLRTVREEVRAWDPALLERPQLVVATKRDAVTEPDPLPALQGEARGLGMEVVPVSAVTGEGLLELKRALARRVEMARTAPEGALEERA